MVDATPFISILMKQPLAIISTDWHIKADNKESILNIAKQEIQLAQGRGVDTIIWLGDMFDSRTSQSQELLILMDSILNMYYLAGLTIHCIPGNHDKTDYGDNRSFLTVFKYHPNFHLYETPDMVDFGVVKFWFMPFYRQDAYLERFQMCMPLGRCVLFSHTAIQGSINNDGSKVESPINASLFKGFEKVFLGHYHNRQQPARNIFHLPSVQQNNFGEDEDKGFTVLYDDLSFESVRSVFKPYREIVVDARTVTSEELAELSKSSVEGVNLRFTFTGDQQAVKKIDRKKFSAVGISVQVKYDDIDVEDADEPHGITVLDGSSIGERFENFCKEKGYDYAKGYKLLKEIMGWQE